MIFKTDCKIDQLKGTYKIAPKRYYSRIEETVLERFKVYRKTSNGFYWFALVENDKARVVFSYCKPSSKIVTKKQASDSDLLAFNIYLSEALEKLR